MAKTTPIIQANNLIPEGFHENLPLHCTIPAQGIYCLIGQESTRLDSFLRALGGILPLQQGQLRLFGQPIDSYHSQQWTTIRMRLAYISRSAPILSVLNGLENVIMPMLYHGRLCRADAELEALSLLKTLQCDANLQLLPAYLNPLQRTQLAIARAVILQPDALIMDEPYHELELHERVLIDGFLADWGQDRALLIATRNLRFVKEHASHILFLGKQKNHHFSSWQELCQSKETEIFDYLAQYHYSYDH